MSDLADEATQDLPKSADSWNWGRVNRWLTLVANIGVFLGVIMLIVELRQNAALTRAAMEQEKNDFLAEIEFNITKSETSEVWIKSIYQPEDLTLAEIKSVETILAAVMLQWDQMFQMEASGLVTRQRVRDHIKNVAPYYFGSRFGKNWWNQQTVGWDGTDMMDVAGPIVDAIDQDFMVRYYDSLIIAPPENLPAAGNESLN